MIRMSIVCARLIDPGEIAAVVPDREDPGDRRDERREAEREHPVAGHVEAERAHARRLVAQALQRQPNGVVARPRSTTKTPSETASVT
jgi:hypothetical protein